MKFPGKKIVTAQELWEKDEEKKLYIENIGYKILYLWEYDINRSTDNDLMNILINFLN